MTVDDLVCVMRRFCNSNSVVRPDAPSFHCPTLSDVGRVRADQLVLDALMVAFDVIVRGEFGCGAADRALTKQNQAVQTRFFNRAQEPLCEGIRMCLQMRRMATLRTELSG